MGKPEDDVHVVVEHANIEEEHSYAALSYVWGDATNNLHPVIINKRGVHWATYNLWQALRRIRQKDNDLAIWIDAFCINQEDPVEKSLQIQLMPRIFPQAHRVLCWLGDDDGTVEEAFETITRWALAYSSDPASSELILDAKRQLERLPNNNVSALGALFNRPYFRRAWCLQEVCHDFDKPPIILCGEHELSWRYLYYGFFNMGSSLYSRELRRLIGDHVAHVLPMLQLDWKNYNITLLSHLIPKAVDREATIPQDKIFSLLGLVQKHGRKYPLPNYSWNIQETCMVFTRGMIEVEQRLDILITVCPDGKGAGAPSWSLNPDNWKSPWRLERFIGHGEDLCIYNATRSTKPLLMPSEGILDPVLKLGGKFLDRISAIDGMKYLSSRLLDKDVQSWRYILDSCRSYCEWLRLPSQYVETSEDMTEAFLRTITLDSFWTVSESDQHWAARDHLFAAYRHHMAGDSEESGVRLGAPETIMGKDELVQFVMQHFRFANHQAQPDEATTTIQASEQGIPVAYIESQVVSDLLDTISENVDSCNFMITENGYIVLAPTSCQVGDKVALFPGSSVPLILREGRSEEHGRVHRLMGNAYVHGIMYGKAFHPDDEASSSENIRNSSQGWALYSIV